MAVFGLSMFILAIGMLYCNLLVDAYWLVDIDHLLLDGYWPDNVH